MKYYLDEDISPRIAELLRKQGIDAVSAHETGMTGVSDREQLEYAASEGRTFITRNRNDFIRLTVQFFNDHRTHSGLLIIPHTLPGDKFSHIAKAIIKHHVKHGRNKPLPYSIDFL